LYWHKCQCWQVAQHECKFRICSIRCLESSRLDVPINCLRKMEKATSSVNTLTAAFSKSCLATVFICLTLFCRGALLSWRSFVAALFCRCAHIAALFCRALKCRRFRLLYVSTLSADKSKSICLSSCLNFVPTIDLISFISRYRSPILQQLQD
jgi:hypothetical protein